MHLMVDIGNTQTVIGIFEKNILIKHWRVTSQYSRTEDEIWVVVDSLFNLEKLKQDKIQGVAISSVVPELSRIYRRMVEKYLSIKPLYITS